MRNIIRRPWGVLLPGVIMWLVGCGSPSPLKVPTQGGVSLEGNVVVWTTDDPTQGSVRFGSRSGDYDRVAYPAAASRVDKALVTEHRVPLLTPAAGSTVYLQVLDRTADGRVAASEEKEFTIETRPEPRPLLEWTMIDVGFGDSHLLTMPSSEKRILVDAGERRDWPNVDKYLEAAGVTTLDVVLGTHIHADHIGGLVGESFTLEDGVLGTYPVDLFLDSPDKSASRYAYDELLDTIDLRGIPMDTVRVGDTDATNPGLDWDSAVEVQVFNSGHGSSIGGSASGDYLNNDSIVLRLTYGEVNLLLGGDAEAPVESKMLLEQGSGLESEVLKVHHHGLDDTSREDFLEAVDARVGMIPITTYESNGGTLPSSVTLARLRERGTDIFASDRAEPLGIMLFGDDGHNVSILTDGQSYEVFVVPSQTDHVAGDQ